MAWFTREVSFLLKQAKPYRGLYSARLAAVLIASIVFLLDPLLIKWLIDDVIPWRKETMLPFVAIGFFCVFFFQLGFNALGFLLDAYTTQRVMFGIRLKLLRHLQRLQSGFFLDTPAGDTLHRIEQDVDQLQDLGGNSIASLLRILVMSTLTLAIMLALSWRLTLVILPLIPLMIIVRRYIYPRLRTASDRAQQANASRVAFFQDQLVAMPQIQLLNRGGGERRRFVRVGRGAMRAALDRRNTELLLGFATNMTFILGNAVVLGYGGSQVLAGKLSVGGLVAFYSYMSRIFGPLEAVVMLYSNLQRASASIRRILDLIEVEPKVKDPARPAKLPRSGPIAVELRSVRFRYKDDLPPVLDGIDLVIRPGEKVALVGVSGCGKSTVARLLTRMYDLDRGNIELDGVDLRDLLLKDLRTRVSLVPQDPILFDVSLKENLLYARPNAHDGELRQVLRMAQLEDTVEEALAGWDEKVGSRGERLSGGQRQRVAIARAVLQRPRLLILDEATSALDGMTERRLLKALEEFVADCTTVLIAHRLSAILWADRIVLLDKGRIVDQGSHADLHRRCELYRHLCERQLRGDEPLTDGHGRHESSDGRALAS